MVLVKIFVIMLIKCTKNHDDKDDTNNDNYDSNNYINYNS